MKNNTKSSHPIKDAKARTKSNLRGAALRALNRAQRKEAAEAAALHEQVARKYRRQLTKLLSRKDLRVMSKIADEVASELREASLAAGGDSVRIGKLRVAAKRKIDRLTKRAVPKFIEARALRRAEMREHQKLSARFLTSPGNAQSQFAWGILHGGPNCVEFVPPFNVVHLAQIDPDRFFVRNDSFARPAIGHLVNNVDFDANEGTPFLSDLFEVETLTSDLAACGVVFTTPRAGRLRVTAVMRSLYNKVMVSITDKFGISSGLVRTFVRLSVIFIRGTDVSIKRKVIRHTGAITHGDDFSFTEEPIDDTVPFTLRKTTLGRFNANEQVLVLAGAEVGIRTVLDDMRVKMNAVLWWEVQSLCIEVVD